MRFIFSLFFSLLLLAVNAQKKAPRADAVLKEAYAKASMENKNVFVLFHASWCGWCHKMDTAMNDPVCKKYFADRFVIVHLTVDEAKEKKHLENEGAVQFRHKYYGDQQGIPFWLIFDKNGKLLADSKLRKEGQGQEEGENIGCPASKAEVDAFVKILKRISTLSSEEERIIITRFRKNEL